MISDNIMESSKNYWRSGVLREVVASMESGSCVNYEDRSRIGEEPAVLKSSCVSRGIFDCRENNPISENGISHAKTKVAKGCVIVSRINTSKLVGSSAFVDKEYDNLFLPDRLWKITPKSTADGRWLGFLIGSALFKNNLSSIISGSSGSMKYISRDKFLDSRISIPPLRQQRLIGLCLSSFHFACSEAEKEVSLLGVALDYLRETLLHSTHRLLGFTDPWPMVSLGQVTRPLTARNKGRHGRDRVMGVTKAEGLVPMREHVIAEEIGRYLRLPPGGFAYNPMRINIGSITMSELDEEVIVSPDYVVFECDRTRLDPRFLNHLRRTQAWADYMTIAGNGSVRVRIYYTDLAGFEFHLPSLAEQARIVEVLDDAEREIALLREEKALREKQRDALATALLTGKLPIPESMLEAERMAAAMAEQGSIAP